MKHIRWKDYPEFESFLKNLPYPCEYTFKDLIRIAERDYGLKVTGDSIKNHLRSLGIKLGYKKTKELPVGTIRVSKRGRREDKSIRLEIKLPDHTWKPYHIYVWEQTHEKLKENERIIFLDGNPLNCDINNLFCATLEERMTYIGKRYYKYKELGAEGKKTALMLAKLEVVIKHNKW